MTNNNNCCVYFHRNKINNKAYIGLSIYGDDINRRWQNGKGYIKQPLFYNAIQKYGWDNFEHIIFESSLSLEDAKKIEVMLIALFNTKDRNFGYNISVGGENFAMSDVDIVKRTTRALDTKNQNRIQKTVEMFKDRYDNGDDNILQCQKCGAYFEKVKNKSANNKKSASKRTNNGKKRKYCDYCSKYHKRSNKIVICSECGREFAVKSNHKNTYTCELCKKNTAQ